MMDFCYIDKGIFKYKETLGLSIYLPGLVRLEEDKASSIRVSWKENLLFVKWGKNRLTEMSYVLSECRLAAEDGILDIFSDVKQDYLAKAASELPF